MNTRRYRLRATATFDRDFVRIIDYIANTLGNPRAAEELIALTEQAVHRRLRAPLAVRPIFLAGKFQYDYYRIRVKNYDVFYVVIGNTMELRRMIYSRRDLAAVLAR